MDTKTELGMYYPYNLQAKKTQIIIWQPSTVVICTIQTTKLKTLPHIQMYIHTLSCLRKNTENIYIYILGCQTEQKSLNGISK